MSVTLNPNPLVLATLQNLSTMTATRGVDHPFSRAASHHTEVRAFGGLGLTVSRSGKDRPSKIRYGAITVTPRAQGSSYNKDPGVHQVIDRGYDNPGVRFGDHIRSGRPVSASGETSCHFSQTSVSKTSPIREMIKAARGGRRRTGSKAAAHVLYVERDGAAEKIDKYELLYGARFTDEMERRAADRSAAAQQAYIERQGAAEGLERVPRRAITDDDLDALDEGSFGTIGATVAERTRFWEAVEAVEATPKGDRIVVKPADNPTWWARAVKDVEGAPAAARATILAEHARGDREPFEIKLPTDKAFGFHQWAVGIDTEAPLEISPGRGGRTQTRIIAELPHELDGRERLQVVRDFTNLLTEKGFPFWAVIHAPDDNNDARNYHVHIAYYDRPASKMKRPNGKIVWDFEIQEEVVYKSAKGGAKRYLARPHQQNRLRETNNQDWVTTLRKHWERSTNRVLEDAGQTKRYNLGTYESMGIALEPQKHINPRTFNKERKGELTEDGLVLARRQWDAAQDMAVKDHQDQVGRRSARIMALADTAQAGMKGHPRRDLAVDFIERLRGLGIEASEAKARSDLMLNLSRIVMDRVMSRPKLIMFDAMKEDDEERRKRGLGEREPMPDRPTPSAEMYGPRTRNELGALIVAISDVALKLDREHERLVQVANSRLRLILEELKAWAAEPMQPVTGAHLVRLRGNPAVDAAEIERQRRSRVATFQADFIRQLEKTLPEFLRTVAERSTAAQAEASPAPMPQESASARTEPARQPAENVKPAEAAHPRAPIAQTWAPTAEYREAATTGERVAPRTQMVKPPAYLSPASILEGRAGRRSSGRPQGSEHTFSSPSDPIAARTAERAKPVSSATPLKTGDARSADQEKPEVGKAGPTLSRRAPVKSPSVEGSAGHGPSDPVILREAIAPSTVTPASTRNRGASTPAHDDQEPKEERPATPRPVGRERLVPATDQRPPAVAEAEPIAAEPRSAPGPIHPVRPTAPAEPSPTERATVTGVTDAPATSRPEASRQGQPQGLTRGAHPPNTAGMVDDVRKHWDREKILTTKEKVADVAKLAGSGEFHPEAIEIAGAERPTKKKSVKPKQRSRGYDFDR